MTTIGEVNTVSNVLQSEHEIEWKISNFSSLSNGIDNFYKSPSFPFADESWYLRVYPNGGVDKESVGCVGLYLVKSSSGPTIKMNYTLGLKSFNGEKDSEHHRIYNFRNVDGGFGVHGCIVRSELLERKSDLMPTDVLTLFCNLKYPKPAADPSSVDCTLVSSVVLNANKVFQDFKDFYLRKELCDVIIKVKGHEFPAHRAILSARSPVFASTYRHDTKEKTTGIIDIEDCEPSSFSDFLCFLYCGDRDIISVENVFSLFTAGDKYDVQDLRTECVRFLQENLSVDTFCDTITLALQHSETELFMSATNFFTEHALEIAKTVKWQSFSANNPMQSNQLFIKALAAKSLNE